MVDKYLERQVGGRLVGPITAFHEYIFRDVLPAFNNIDGRAQQLAQDYYERISCQPAGEYEELDMADIAEAAQDQSMDWYDMMTSLRQTMLNLLAAGLSHLVEQQLGMLSQDASFSKTPLKTVRLEDVAGWYLAVLCIDLKALNSWKKIDELRLVANAVKHAEGAATNQLRLIRSELFTNPAYAHMFPELDRAIESASPVSAPLSGEDFFVTLDVLREYSESAEAFFREIASCFR